MELTVTLDPSAAGSDTPGPDMIICSARGCRQPAGWAVVWNNPRIHAPDREKVWTACDEHREHLADYLRRRSMLRRVDPLGTVTATEDRTPPDGAPPTVPPVLPTVPTVPPVPPPVPPTVPESPD